MSGYLHPSRIQEQERKVRVLQGQTVGLMALSGVLCLSPMFVKMDRTLNFLLLSMSPLLAYAGIEYAHKLEEREAPYCTAKTFAKQLIAKTYAAEATNMQLTLDHQVAQTHAALNPPPQQRQIQYAQPQQQLPAVQQQESGVRSQERGENQTQAIATTQPQQSAGLADTLVASLADYKIPVSCEGRVEGSCFDRYLLKKQASGIKFSQITKLTEELQLDLGLDSEPIISIQNGFIAVDVPRQSRKTFHYHDFIKPGIKPEGGLWLPIGVSLNGQLIEVDMSGPDACHILGGGVTGGGKSVWLDVAVKSLCDRYDPSEVMLMLSDYGKASFGCFEGDPHLICPVLYSIDDIIEMQEVLVGEMERRKTLLNRHGVPHLTALNKKLDTPLPRICDFTDEYTAAIEAASDTQRKKLESNKIKLSLEARKAGIHLLTFMQRPEEDYLDGQIRSNHPASVCLKVKRAEDSKMVLGESGLGGEKLLGQGDLLFSYKGRVERLQSLFWEPGVEASARVGDRAYTFTPQPYQPSEEAGPYAYRYPPNWKQISHEAKILTGTLCCFPGCRHEATETHHARYQDEYGRSICDEPLAGIDIFPLCSRHHSHRSDPECAHHKENWVYGTCQEPLEIDSQNTPQYYQKLRQGWQEKTQKFEQFIRMKVAA
jgi:DNA segregation ATPase FtsK/SpoIIIE-like protein